MIEVGQRVQVKDNYPGLCYVGKTGVVTEVSPSLSYPYRVRLDSEIYQPLFLENELKAIN